MVCLGNRTADTESAESSRLLMQNWVETFIQKKNIIIYDLEEIAEETPQEYEILKPQNIHALIAVPIYTNHKFIGFIGIG